MGNCCGCCALPETSKVRIKVCFTRSSLAGCRATTNDYPTFNNSISVPNPDIAFEILTTAGSRYYDFLSDLQNELEKENYGIYLRDCFFKDKIRFIRYETCKDNLLKTYSLPYDKSFHNITFNWLFFHLSFLDWTQLGYALIIWFDQGEFKTILDLTNNPSVIHNVLSNKLQSKIQTADRERNEKLAVNDGNNGVIVGESAPILMQHNEQISNIFDNDPQTCAEGFDADSHDSNNINNRTGNCINSNINIGISKNIGDKKRIENGYYRLKNQEYTIKEFSRVDNNNNNNNNMNNGNVDGKNYIFGIQSFDVLNLLLMNDFEVTKSVGWYVDAMNRLNSMYGKCLTFTTSWKESRLVLKCLEELCVNSVNVLIGDPHFDWIWRYQMYFSPFAAVSWKNNEFCYLPVCLLFVTFFLLSCFLLCFFVLLSCCLITE